MKIILYNFEKTTYVIRSKMLSLVRKVCKHSNLIQRFTHTATVKKVISLAKTKPNITLLNDAKIVNDVLNNDFTKYCNNSNLKNFSGSFGEKLVEELLILKNIQYKKQFVYENVRPDFITQTDIIEVKTTLKANKNYDMILFSPFKYFNLSCHQSKNIKIVLVGYDEVLFEKFKKNNQLFNEYIMFQSKNNIEYVFYNNELISI